MIPATNHSVAAIKRAVARNFEVTVPDIDGRTRTGNLALARHVAMHLARSLLKSSYPAIAAQFCRQNHMTVIHATRVIACKMASDRIFAARVDMLASVITRKLRKAA